jgi:hypothetical protein
MKLIKLSFTSLEEWEQVKETLQSDGSWLEGINTVWEHGNLPKAPPVDFVPDPNNPDDNGWSSYPDYAVDILAEDSFDSSVLDNYKIKKIDGQFLFQTMGGTYDFEYKVIPDESWSKPHVEKFFKFNGIKYAKKDSKVTLLGKLASVTIKDASGKIIKDGGINIINGNPIK